MEESIQAESTNIDTSDKVTEVSWYPGPPKTEIPMVSSVFEKLQLEEKEKQEQEDPWKATGVKYTSSNKWQGIDKTKIENSRRHKIHGVEIRKLPKGHPLAGEYGLFAAKRFSKFDIIGEYTGKIVGNTIGGHYVAVLEDKEYDDSLGIDAEKHGNEMRFINSFLNVDFEANVVMKTVYVNTYPHIVIVCKKDIEVGDELLLDYGEEYTKAYLTAKPKIIGEVAQEIIHKSLPFCDSESEEEA